MRKYYISSRLAQFWKILENSKKYSLSKIVIRVVSYRMIHTTQFFSRPFYNSDSSYWCLDRCFNRSKTIQMGSNIWKSRKNDGLFKSSSTWTNMGNFIFTQFARKSRYCPTKIFQGKIEPINKVERVFTMIIWETTTIEKTHPTLVGWIPRNFKTFIWKHKLSSAGKSRKSCLGWTRKNQGIRPNYHFCDFPSKMTI